MEKVKVNPLQSARDMVDRIIFRPFQNGKVTRNKSCNMQMIKNRFADFQLERDN